MRIASRWIIIAAVLLLSLALVGGALGAAGRANPDQLSTAQKQASPPAQLPEGQGPWVVRAYFTNRKMVNTLSSRYEPWEVRYEQGSNERGFLVIEVDRPGYLYLLELGFRLEVDAELTRQLNEPPLALPGQVNGIPGFPCYRTVEETFSTAQAIVAAYPRLATWMDVGDSWEKTQPGGLAGYDMMVLRLTNELAPGPKPRLFVTSSIHAREYTPAELATRFAEYLVANYNSDPDVTWLLDYHEIHLMLHANPDGRKIAEGGSSWRKNTDNDDGCVAPNPYGVDLNRNFAFKWGCCGGSSGAPCDETYRGPASGSEPETQAIQNHMLALFPDQRGPGDNDPAPPNATGVYLDLHSYSQLVLWSWGWTPGPAPNSQGLQTFGRKMAFFNGYTPQQSYQLYATDGTTKDYAYGIFGVAGYTIELGTSFFQSCSAFENTIYPDNLQTLLYAARVARNPYQTPSGPDALHLSAVPLIVSTGTPVQLSATLNDTRFNNSFGTEPVQNIAQAEYYIDTPYWVTYTTPVAYPMAPADGAFNSPIEGAVASIDTASLAQGRHTAFVRGRDAAGNWGPVSAVWFYVLDPANSPSIQGYVRQAGTGVPLQAQVSASPVLQTTSDPASGFYSLLVFSGTYDVSAVAAGHLISTVAGLTVQNNQVVNQDFELYPTCNVLSHDAEAGQDGWTGDYLWQITSESAHSPTHAWSDSPGGSYGSNKNVSLTSPTIDLSGLAGAELSFWHTHSFAGGDYGFLEYSTDNGASWVTAATFNGSGGSANNYIQTKLPLPALDGENDSRIRFRLKSDAFGFADGWHIDDIVLSASGAACIPQNPPSAEFSSNSPVNLGQPVQFTDLTSGTQPFTYNWDFGDGAGSSQLANPAYIYQAPGAYTVTLAVSNSLGSDSVQHAVNIYANPGIDLQPITAGLSGDPGATLTYTLRLTNTGGLSDTFSLSVVGAAWTTGLAPASLGSLDPGSGQELRVRVSIPLTAYGGEQDRAKIVVSSSHAWVNPITATLTSEANPVYNLGASVQDDSQEASPGSKASYTLLVTNTGNTSDTYSVTISGTWAASLSPPGQPVTLGAGESAMLFIAILIPPTTPLGNSSTTTVVISSTGNPSISRQLILTTTAGNYRLRFPWTAINWNVP